MHFSKLLGKQLKDDAVMEILEHFDIVVVYDFDRTHENMADVYWAASKENGFQFRFDENQILDVIFLYIVANEGFTPLSRNEIDVPIYESYADAKESFEKQGLQYVSSPSEDPGDSRYQRWIKAESGAFTAHYQFKDSKLCMITLINAK